MAVTVTSNADNLAAALARFTSRELPDVADQAARKIALDVVAGTVRRITSGPPKRVDTGRYRAGWRSGLDSAVLSGNGLTRTVTVQNAVEYGIWVEVGTATMAPGNHLLVTLADVRRQVPEDIGAGSIQSSVLDAWKR